MPVAVQVVVLAQHRLAPYLHLRRIIVGRGIFFQFHFQYAILEAEDGFRFSGYFRRCLFSFGRFDNFIFDRRVVHDRHQHVIGRIVFLIATEPHLVGKVVVLTWDEGGNVYLQRTAFFAR